MSTETPQPNYECTLAVSNGDESLFVYGPRVASTLPVKYIGPAEDDHEDLPPATDRSPFAAPSPQSVLKIDIPPSNPVTPRFAAGTQPVNECPSCNGDGVVTSDDDEEEDGVVERASRASDNWFSHPVPKFIAHSANWPRPPSPAAMAARVESSTTATPAPSAPIVECDPAYFDGSNVYWNRGPSPAAPSHNPEVDVPELLSGQELFEKYGGGAWKIPANDPRRRRYLNLPPSPNATPPVTPPASSRQRARDSLLLKLQMAESLLNTPRRSSVSAESTPSAPVDQIQALTARVTLLEATVAALVDAKAAAPTARELVRLELLRKVIASMDFRDLDL